MTGHDRRSAGLTRALFIGVTVGSIPLVQVGCVPIPMTMGAAPAPARAAVAVPSATERELCDRLLASRSSADATALIRAYPRAECIPAALSTMSPAALAGISPAAVRLMPASVYAKIPPQTARHLRVARDSDGGSDNNRGSGTY